jgi:hypothetical protein
MPKKKKSLWDRVGKVQKIIAVAAAAIPVIFGLIKGYPELIKGYQELKLAKDDPKKCANFEIRTFAQIPYYLVNTIKKQQGERIYWAFLAGENRCKNPVNIKVKFEVINREIASTSGKDQPFTIRSGETKSQSIDPDFKFYRDDVDTPIKVRWEILNWDTNKPLKGDTPTIELVSKKYVYWNLKDPSEKFLPLDFLLASLSAWALNPDEPTRERSKEFLKEIDPAIDSCESYRRWLKRCYTDLFFSATRLYVRPYLEPWPPTGEGQEGKQIIRSPMEILDTRDPNSLEALLLISAFREVSCRIVDSRLALFALPTRDEGKAGVKRFLLSWSIDGKDWFAIDMTNPHTLSFEENETRTTSELKDLLKSSEQILLALNKNGVFIDKERKILALEFDKAARSYQIAGLP